jgi:hypothetical protein
VGNYAQRNGAHNDHREQTATLYTAVQHDDCEYNAGESTRAEPPKEKLAGS